MESNTLSATTREDGTKLIVVSADSIDAASTEEKAQPPSIRPGVCLHTSARSGRQPQAKRQAGTTEDQISSAANEEPEPITPPLPLQDPRAVAAKDAGARFGVLDGSSDKQVEQLSHRVRTAKRELQRAEVAHALATSTPSIAPEFEAVEVPRLPRQRSSTNFVITSGNWRFSGCQISEAIENVRGIEMVDFAAPAKTVEAVESCDGWVVVFWGGGQGKRFEA
ncbi:hypothetical protein B0T14DRAFT_569675 [Immersiella caudata]|uniref:Uncharacterized protein n=1 Tax=Immersiella caudata TaxID=314043 RepID=A0AA39WE09_9PEZI|nr:hypothetical protein B0T14DRAFT_569675 [Immersiella caudata]